jgi:putative hydrolase of the HAD superfamily
VRAVIFDLWDTLIPFDVSGRDAAVRAMAEVLGAPVEAFASSWSASMQSRFTGSNEGNLLQVCTSVGIEPGLEEVTEALAIRSRHTESTFSPREGAIEALGDLRTAGLAIGLITNCSSEVPELWPRSPLALMVDAAVFSCQEGIKKPDAAIYLLASERLGVQPQSCAYVGDGSDGELPGAQAVGMTPVLLESRRSAGDLCWQGASVQSLDQLPPLVRALGTA